MGKAKVKAKKEPITDQEKKRMQAMKLVDNGFAIRKDKFGRDRMAPIATAARDYDIGNKLTVVRVRNVDPLQGISSLSWQQRQAGKRFRDDYETCSREGLKTGSWEMRVDGSGSEKDRPARIAQAQANLASAQDVLGYGEIRRTVTMVAGECMSVSALSKLDRNPRDVVSTLLGMGLQKLAVHYGFVS